MKLRFELPTIERKQLAIEYIKEFHRYKSAINGTGGLDIKDYENWLIKVSNSHKEIDIGKGRVPASTYFVFDENDNLVGMVNIRHRLNEYLINSGSGHIGYSVKPLERRKGYATKILKLALNVLHNDFEVNEALLGCYKDNIGSMKTIVKNGGIFDREIIDEDNNISLAFKLPL